MLVVSTPSSKRHVVFLDIDDTMRLISASTHRNTQSKISSKSWSIFFPSIGVKLSYLLVRKLPHLSLDTKSKNTRCLSRVNAIRTVRLCYQKILYLALNDMLMITEKKVHIQIERKIPHYINFNIINENTG